MAERETWTNKIDFLFACVGFSVGLGNVWRFPYLCYKNGGGAFLLPYFLSVFLCSYPMLLLEVSLGQLTRQGGINAWLIAPIMQGVGYAGIITVFLLNCMYNVILAWTLHFLGASFFNPLPWSRCDTHWTTAACVNDASNSTMANLTGEIKCSSLENGTSLNGTSANETSNATSVSSAVEYWNNRVLQQTVGIESPGGMQWELVGTLFLAWVIVYLCICQGIKSSGKVMYFTAPAPYVFMLVLLIRGAFLDGARDGIVYYLRPDFDRLRDAKVWVDALTQVFFSTSISIGTLSALGSFNKFHHNSLRDASVFALINSLTSLLAGFVIFSVLGYMSKKVGVCIEDIARSGPGLAFIAYPEALSTLQVVPQLWSVLFFIMVLLLGLDSQFVGVEGFTTAVYDHFPEFFAAGKWRKPAATAAICFIKFLVGLAMVTRGGIYVFELFNEFPAARMLMLIAFFECITISYVYGIRRFMNEIQWMWGFQLPLVFRGYLMLLWAVISPILCLVGFIMAIYEYGALLKLGDYEYPSWAVTLGWLLAALAPLAIPFVAIWRRLRPIQPLNVSARSSSYGSSSPDLELKKPLGKSAAMENHFF